MAKTTKGQKQTIDRVMHEYKHGELETAAGDPVKTPKQAIAIALSESGASNRQSPDENRARYRKTKAAERAGDTGRDRAERGPTAPSCMSGRSSRMCRGAPG